MIIEIKPELEQIVQEEIQSGHFQNVDDLLTQAIQALREKSHSEPATATPAKKRLIDVLRDPAFAGSELNITRQKDYPRPVNL